MVIGIDLRALQTGHKFRGIGEVAKQVTNRVLENGKADNDVRFVFYEYDDDNPKELLDVPKKLEYSVVKLGPMPEGNAIVSKGEKVKRNFKALYGKPIENTKQCDVFLQFDYAFGVPRDTKTVLVKHDLIPYVFWDKYFESAWVPFKNKAVRTTLRTLFANHKFDRILRRSLKNAHVIVAVSNNTKKDVEKYFRVKPSKVKVALLGVDTKPAKTSKKDVSRSDMPTKPYLLFVGAGDARRTVEETVHVFNNLKARGEDIQLVLAGENFKSPEDIPSQVVRKAVMGSSYKNDILTMGYIDDDTKQTLFKNAIAFVYATRYEGFGIPILEAMLLDCPIIVSDNSSVREVGGDYAFYADDWQHMQQHVEDILAMNEKEKAKHLAAARKHAESFTWDKTAGAIYNELKEVGQ